MEKDSGEGGGKGEKKRTIAAIEGEGAAGAEAERGFPSSKRHRRRNESPKKGVRADRRNTKRKEDAAKDRARRLEIDVSSSPIVDCLFYYVCIVQSYRLPLTQLRRLIRLTS